MLPPKGNEISSVKYTDNIAQALEEANQKLPEIADNIHNIMLKTFLLTKKKYKIIYSFSDRCHSCVETFPTLVKFISENSEKFEL